MTERHLEVIRRIFKGIVGLLPVIAIIALIWWRMQFDPAIEVIATKVFHVGVGVILSMVAIFGLLVVYAGLRTAVTNLLSIRIKIDKNIDKKEHEGSD